MGYNDWDNDNEPAVDRDHDWRAVPGDFDTIPVIDVAGIRSDDFDERRKIAAQIRDACVRVGFFYIQNHGINDDVIQGVFKAAETFFALPFEQKMEVFIDNSPNFRGYTPIGGSGKPGADGRGNLNEAFEWGHDSKLNDDPNDACDDPYMKGRNRWPREPADFEDQLSTYYRELRAFCRLLARSVALSLGLDEDYFSSCTSHPGCASVLAHYPPQERGAAARGLDAHTDSEFFTILAPGPVRALEVVNKAGEWISAPPKPGTFIVNVGDQLQAFTNDLYISTRHRVMNYTGQQRYAIPFFFSTNFETVIKPIPELLTGDQVARNRQVSAGQMYKENMTSLHRIASAVPDFAKYRKEEASTV
ncbi:2OG-Fe(II)oxygenase superfamily protein [Colletotrichum tamarilloi]|uniref:2OG-Fe(II)oxygenase superfamily protein n=1 Tax=Colletotrichum tamarilloi TaxID=1209934 RepID=A0ABQ9R7E5_9PEZI|nr:2OG-Fe(II)oxygenase superfamily protein [Colletotrichum tamarilloi]KAK1497214.1 2OG-Fe(II)oxygenase superfamily protein [Colletotrichum tamarilloi]